MIDHMTAIDADEPLERADVCAFRDTARELLRADASPWQLRTALDVAVGTAIIERASCKSEFDTMMAQSSDEHITLDRNSLYQLLTMIFDAAEQKYGPDCGAEVLLDACLEIATRHSRAVVHMMVNATYNRLEGEAAQAVAAGALTCPTADRASPSSGVSRARAKYGGWLNR